MAERKKGPGMAIKAMIVVVLAVAIGAAVVARNASRAETGTEASIQDSPELITRQEASGPEEESAVDVDQTPEQTMPSKPLPKLVDLGAKKCIPCKMMAPILDDLREEYKGRFDVVFIDVWENPDAGKEYTIRVIPTQIFFDAGGRELFRHEGFFSREDILGKWEEMGIVFDALNESSATGDNMKNPIITK